MAAGLFMGMFASVFLWLAAAKGEFVCWFVGGPVALLALGVLGKA